MSCNSVIISQSTVWFTSDPPNEPVYSRQISCCKIRFGSGGLFTYNPKQPPLFNDSLVQCDAYTYDEVLELTNSPGCDQDAALSLALRPITRLTISQSLTPPRPL